MFIRRAALKEGLQLHSKEIPIQVFSCEICEISKNTFFYRPPPVTASDWSFEQKDDVKSLSETPKNITESNLQATFQNIKKILNTFLTTCAASASNGFM